MIIISTPGRPYVDKNDELTFLTFIVANLKIK